MFLKRVPRFQDNRYRWLARGACILLWTATAIAQNQPSDLTQLSLEQLAKVEVTSVSRKEQRLNDVAAAVYVITQQDIRNSPAVDIPGLLEMVPGLDVARISGGRWAISARGFAEQYNQDMLVLIDGNSIFDPVFSGVLWSETDLMLEDIDRIEVIRGPGAAMWGGNAFNGVINIITKASQETKGTLMTASLDQDGRAGGAVRYGGTLGKSSRFRIYSKYLSEGPGETLSGLPAHDSSVGMTFGFRVDANTSEHDAFMVEGRGFNNKIGYDNLQLSYAPPFTFSTVDFFGEQAESLFGRWIHKSENGAATTVQGSFLHLTSPSATLDVNGNVGNVSVQHERALGNRHDLVAGLELDVRHASTSSFTPTIWWQPNAATVYIGGGFIQDEMLFVDGAVHLIGGVRMDHDTLSGLAAQPTLRSLWKMNAASSVWAAYSLASRPTSFSDAYVQTNIAIFPTAGGTEVLRLVSNPAIKQEKMHAFELGYRVQPSKRFSLDAATFYNRYFDAIGAVPRQPFLEAGPPSRLVLPLVQQNNISGGVFGGELAAKWMPSPDLSLTSTYSLIELGLTQSPSTPGNAAQTTNGSTPRHQLNLQIAYNLRRTLTLNTTMVFVDRRTAQAIPGYTETMAALMWRPVESGEFKLGVSNLLGKEHAEFISNQGGFSSPQGRTLYGKVTWHF